MLLRAVMPATEVDAMLAAGPARRHCNPDLEVPMAHRSGALAVGAATGVGTVTAFSCLTGGRAPHLIVASIRELLEICAAARGPAGR